MDDLRPDPLLFLGGKAGGEFQLLAEVESTTCRRDLPEKAVRLTLIDKGGRRGSV